MDFLNKLGPLVIGCGLEIFCTYVGTLLALLAYLKTKGY